MQPFTFGTDKERNREELKRFEGCCGKPGGLNAAYAKRLDFYLYRQRPHVKRAIEKLYPNTHQDVLPYLETLRLTPFFVNEQAKVFLQGAQLELTGKDAKPLAADDDKAKRWVDLQDEMALGLKLKLVDRYATLDRVCFLRIDQAEGGPMRAQVFLPQHVDVAFDPAHPGDLDMAHGVRLRVGGEEQSEILDADGKPASKGGRFEFWCARPGDEQYRIVWDDGTLEPIPGNEKGAVPYRDEANRAVVPLVMFALHTEELGVFTDAEAGLVEFNEALDVAVTDLNHIATVQGFGQLVISYKEGLEPAKQQQLAIGPSRALELKDGATAAVLSPAAQVAALLDKVDRAIKRQANLHGIPPGAVSLEGRQVPSGLALQIEMRPLMEARTDAIDLYRAPVRRVWRIARIVHDARAADGEKFGPELKARWTPGEVQIPESEDAILERLVLAASKGWISDAEAVAKLRKVGIEEAEQILAKIRAEKAARRPTEEEAMGLRRRGPPVVEEPPEDEPEDEEPETAEE